MNKQRLIDKDALIAFIKSNGYVYANSLETFPEVDAESVVRCGECKHFKCDCDNPLYSYCELGYLDCCISGDTFCSYGERKESEVHNGD